jgi:hypothetical protein
MSYYFYAAQVVRHGPQGGTRDRNRSRNGLFTIKYSVY